MLLVSLYSLFNIPLLWNVNLMTDITHHLQAQNRQSFPSKHLMYKTWIFSNRYLFINIKWLTILSEFSGRYVPGKKRFTKHWRYSTAWGGALSIATKKVIIIMIIIILIIVALDLAIISYNVMWSEQLSRY